MKYLWEDQIWGNKQKYAKIDLNIEIVIHSDINEFELP